MDGYMEACVAGYDPHYFHVDPERAKESPYGGLIASGWHTAALMMRLLVDNFISAGSSRCGRATSCRSA